MDEGCWFQEAWPGHPRTPLILGEKRGSCGLLAAGTNQRAAMLWTGIVPSEPKTPLSAAPLLHPVQVNQSSESGLLFPDYLLKVYFHSKPFLSRLLIMRWWFYSSTLRYFSGLVKYIKDYSSKDFCFPVSNGMTYDNPCHTGRFSTACSTLTSISKKLLFL